MSKEELLTLVISQTCEVLPELAGHSFQSSDRLADLGANSLDRAEIVMMVMEALSLQIPRVELFGARNIGELVDVLHSKLESV
ncbi:acyl carrier protein [Paenibacillus maysiensis]|uniref:acyl carrier protein n=1 Tax=Paenibacillus maysiensis TaxID=1155954 RepID=UPI000472F7DB|nr:acyl carrier protein [Paenibacillus maysiensis]